MNKKEILERLDYIQEKISHFDIKQAQLDFLDVRYYIEKLEIALKIYQHHTKIIHDDSKNELTNFKELWLIMLKSNWNYDDLLPKEYELLKELEEGIEDE